MSERASLSVKKLAVFLGVSETIVYRLTHCDDFPVLELGKRRLIPVDAWKVWIAKQSHM